MAERAAARKRAEAKRESQKRDRAGSHKPLKHFFDPQRTAAVMRAAAVWLREALAALSECVSA